MYKPPSRWAGIFKAIIIALISGQILFQTAALSPVLAVIAALALLSAIVYLIVALFI